MTIFQMVDCYVLDAFMRACCVLSWCVLCHKKTFLLIFKLALCPELLIYLKSHLIFVENIRKIGHNFLKNLKMAII